MRVYIMTDMEGVAGILNFEDWCEPASRYYDLGREFLTREVNAAVEGFLAAGATEILVADGHGYGGINPALLHSAAELARHWPAGSAYPFSLDSRRFDFMCSIGQHPKAGTLGGHLCHTGSMIVRDVSINGLSVGEFGEICLCGSELGTRVIFAAGCEAFTREAQALLPGIETVAVKRGQQTKPGHHLPEMAYQRHNASAIHLVPEEARRRIRAGSQRALERARREPFGHITLQAPFRRVTLLRSSDLFPPRVRVDEHPSSVIALLNQSGPYHDMGEASPDKAAL